MKRLKYLFLLIFLCTPFFVHASTNTFVRTAEKPLVPRDVVIDTTNLDKILKTPAISASEKIYDFADLYSEQQEKLLFNQIDNYIDNSGIDLVVVTTNNLNGFSLADYAYNFYDYNDFGIEGVIFVIYLGPTEPEVYMGNSGDKTGKVFATYSRVRIEQTLKYIYNDLKKGDYYTATKNYIKIIDGFYNIDTAGDYVVNEDGEVVRQLPWIEIVILTVALTFIAVMLCLFQISGNNRLKFKDDLADKIDEKTLMFRTESDEYIGTSILKKK